MFSAVFFSLGRLLSDANLCESHTPARSATD